MFTTFNLSSNAHLRASPSRSSPTFWLPPQLFHRSLPLVAQEEVHQYLDFFQLLCHVLQLHFASLVVGVGLIGLDVLTSPLNGFDGLLRLTLTLQTPWTTSLVHVGQ